VPFTANAQVAAGRHVDVVAGTSFEVRRFDSRGSLRRIARIERDPTSVDGAARADFRQFAENSMPPTRRDAALDALDHRSVPDFAPAYRFLVVGSDGSSWAYRYAPIPMNEPWDVFLPDGAFAGVVAVPSRFHITAPRDRSGRHVTGRGAPRWRSRTGDTGGGPRPPPPGRSRRPDRRTRGRAGSSSPCWAPGPRRPRSERDPHLPGA